ncbi:cyclin-dependent kinase 11B-like [Mercenaria mercenaria]|uniref:cyclin-dependent kinase 11B-like n=1 Tax=Mercenaria mercenaria TaxID=6596 RepID=UPI001E1D2457|nr:cyclin-dependent kinase 11B-like [Mercenaria mercenaria]
MSRRKVTLVSDRSPRSPYEQGELASSSPELAARSEDNETSEHEMEEEEEEEEHVQSDRDQDMPSADEEDHDDGPGIKPPPVPVKKKEKHKHKHKEDRKKDKQKDRHREEKDRHREKDRGHEREHREERGARGIQDRHERKVLTGRERERELKEKLLKEKEKREKSRMERERLERLEREKNRDRKLREERERREQERRKRKEEERRLQQQRKEREEIRNRKERMIKEKERMQGRPRSRSRERREGSRDTKSRHSHRSSDKGSSSGGKVHEEHERPKERKVQMKKEIRESEEEHIEEKHEIPDTAMSPSEDESEDTESDSGSGTDTTTDSDDSSDEEDHKDDEKIKSESPDHDNEDADKKHLAKSKFDQSDNESETGSVHLNDHHDDDGYLAETPPMSPVELKPDLPPYFPAIQGCRSVEEFSCLNKIEEGTYGVVYRARDKKTDEIVALKRLKMEKEKEGFPITSLREINTLLKAQHTNIVTVREIVVGSNMDKIYIVMDYVEHDLKSLMAPETMKQPFLVGEVKTLMLQLLRGVQHLHDNWIIHRDLKTSNLLLSHKGILKIGDFGLAREYGEPLKQYTPIVVTLWYRSPELLLGIKEYSTPIDMWSVGCIMAEFLVMKAIWQGKTEIEQLQLIFKDLGTPTEKIYPGVMDLPGMKKCVFIEYPYNTLRNKFGQYLSDQGFNLLNRFLTYNPSKRIAAGEALKHEYFRESPVPIDPSMFPTWPAKSEQVRKHASSPKPPSGGKAYSKLLDDGDDAIAAGFQFRQAAKGVSAIGPGFSLKF